MKITLLSGAYKNAGDFLIVHRCKKLLEKIVRDCKITEIERRCDLENQLDVINHSDVLLIGGGPAYVRKMYPTILPLVNDLNRIKVPIFAMGLGWKERNAFPRTVYGYNFTDTTLKLLKRIEADGYSLGCRDFFSERVLWNNGIKNTMMTGCAAWYDLDYIEQEETSFGEIRRIIVSEPANPKNYSQFLELIRFLMKRFPNSEIKVLFHRGIKSDQFTSEETGNRLSKVIKQLESMHIPYEDISYGYEGLNRYKECDIHIGYRVHAHIYNLSQHRRSILIEEDSRGCGVNQAVGLQDIFSYEVERENRNKTLQRVLRKIHFCGKTSESVCRELDDYLHVLEDQSFIQFEWVFKRMKYYYSAMCEHLEQLNRPS